MVFDALVYEGGHFVTKQVNFFYPRHGMFTIFEKSICYQFKIVTMKTHSFKNAVILGIFVLSTFISRSDEAFAQGNGEFKSTNTLPLLLDSVVKCAPNLFYAIQGENYKDGNYNSLLNVQDAEKTYIRNKTLGKEWVVEYGEFKTLEAANARLDELKQQFVQAFPNAFFVEYNKPYAERPEMELCFPLSEKGIRCSDVKFNIATVKKKFFDLQCVVNGVRDKPCFVNFFPISFEPGTSQFAQDLRLLIKESESRFDSVQGELISENMYKLYHATKVLESAQECTIRKPLFGSTYYAKMVSGISKDQVADEFKKVVTKVAEGLGSDYYYIMLFDGSGMNFVPKSTLSFDAVPSVSVVVEKESEAYAIYVKIQQVSIF
jgi:hypothetical protein